MILSVHRLSICSYLTATAATRFALHELVPRVNVRRFFTRGVDALTVCTTIEVQIAVPAHWGEDACLSRDWRSMRWLGDAVKKEA